MLLHQATIALKLILCMIINLIVGIKFVNLGIAIVTHMVMVTISHPPCNH